MPTSKEECLALDEADPLQSVRRLFSLPEKIIYLDGNSLGPLPVATGERVASVVQDQWGKDLITSWNKNGWIDLPHRIGDKIARLIGAAPGEVVVADSTSVNLFKALAAALRLKSDRRDILSERNNFPTDLYMAQGLLELTGGSGKLRHVAPGEDIVAAINDSVAVVMLTQVNYRTGAKHDMKEMTRRVHERGALVIWDLSHSAGAVPVDLGDAGADFAVGCGYKYLNGGPGAPAFIYVPKRHQPAARQPLSGWMGHAAPFSFDPDYTPGEGVTRFLCGTPQVLSMVALEVGVDLILSADRNAMWEKSQRQLDLFIALIESWCGEHVKLATPRDRRARGSQACFANDNGYAVMQALIALGVIGDFRAPNILRFGICPLFVRYVDIWNAAAALRDVLNERQWDREEYRRLARVT